MELPHNHYQINSISTDEFNATRLEYLALAGSGIPLEFGAPGVILENTLRSDLAPVYAPNWIVGRSLRQMLKRIPFTPEMLVARYVDLGLSELMVQLVQQTMNFKSSSFAGVEFTFNEEDVLVIQRSFLTSCLRDPRLESNEIIPNLHPRVKMEVLLQADALIQLGLKPITSPELAAWL